MRITLQIIVEAPSHNVVGSDLRRARRYRRGDIVNVYRTAQVTEPPNPNGRLGFIHVRSVPDRFNFAMIQRRFLRPESRNDDALSTLHPDDPGAYRLVRKRRWRVLIPELNNAKRSQLLNDGETTLQWPVLMGIMRRKQVTQETDASNDDEAEALTEAFLDSPEVGD